MARKGLAPGEHGEVQLTRQRRDERGQWVRVDRGGTRWRARCRYRAGDGTYSEVSGFAQTKRLAEESLTRLLAERQRSGSDALTGSTPLVVAGRQWVERIARSDSGLSARSVADYAAAFTRYVDAPGSSLRGLTLREADDPGRLTAFLRSVADKHGNGAAKQARVVLAHIFRVAVRNRAIPTSPMRDVETVRSQAPKESARDTSRAFTREERDHVVSYALALASDTQANPRTERKRWAVADLLAFLAGTGVRINEARLLRWEDVDLAAGSVVIRGTKTQSALRRVNLAPWLAERLSAGAERLGTDGLVFASPALADPEAVWEQSNSANALAAVLRAAGYPWATPHTFRHTAASLLHEQGVPLARIADWLGHRDIAVTAGYLGRDLGSDKAALAGLL